MAFDWTKLSPLFEAVESLGRFAEGLKQIQVPNVPGPSYGDPTERLEAMEEYAREVGVYLSQMRDLPLPDIQVSRETLDEAMHELDGELARTRQGNFEVVGARDVEFPPNGIKVILETPEPDSGGEPLVKPGCFPVTLTVTAETAADTGDSTTECGYEYDVTDPLNAEGDALAEDVDPTAEPHQCARPALGARVAATAGLAYWNEDGDLVLAYMNEVDNPEACS